MTTEEDFQRQLDEHPDDFQTRLVLADWLQDRGDERAEGYRALGVLRKSPAHFTRAHACWAFHAGQGRRIINDSGDSEPVPEAHALPGDWVGASGSTHGWIESGHYGVGERRSDVEDAAALAFARLPASRRAELLAANG